MGSFLLGQGKLVSYQWSKQRNWAAWGPTQAPQQSTLGWLVRFEGLAGEIEVRQPTELVDEPQSNQPQWLIEKVGIHLREQPVESFIQSCRAMHAPEPCGHFETRVWEVILG